MIPTEELAAWLAGEADPAVAARVESAMAEDPDVAARVAALRRVEELLAAVPTPVPSDEAVGRITAAAMASARDVLDAEDEASEAAGARSAGRGLAGAGAAASGRPSGAGRDADGRSPAGAPRSASPSGALTWSNLWSSWVTRAVAAAAIVALVAVGALTVGPGGLLGGDDSAQEDSFASADMATEESLEMATEAAVAEDSATEAAAGPTEDQATPSSGGDSGAVSAAPIPTSWAELVEGSQPHVVATPEGDVLMLDVGRRLDTFTVGPGVTATQEPGVDDGDDFLTPAILTEWLRVTLPDADGLAPGDLVADDGLVTEPEADRVRDCLTRREADADPSDPVVVVAFVGAAITVDTPGDDGGPRNMVALVDEEATVELRDAATCTPIDE